MSTYKIQTPGNYPEESIWHSGHGEILKPGIFNEIDNTFLGCGTDISVMLLMWYQKTHTHAQNKCRNLLQNNILIKFFIKTTCLQLWHVSFLCCWQSHSCGMWCHIVRRAVLDVSKDFGAFIFKVLQAQHCKWSECLWNVGQYLCKNTLSHPGRVETWSNVSFLTPMCVGSSVCSTAVVLVNAIMSMSLFHLTCLIWPPWLTFLFLQSSAEWKKIFCIWNSVQYQLLVNISLWECFDVCYSPYWNMKLTSCSPNPVTAHLNKKLAVTLPTRARPRDGPAGQLPKVHVSYWPWYPHRFGVCVLTVIWVIRNLACR